MIILAYITLITIGLASIYAIVRYYKQILFGALVGLITFIGFLPVPIFIILFVGSMWCTFDSLDAFREEFGEKLGTLIMVFMLLGLPSGITIVYWIDCKVHRFFSKCFDNPKEIANYIVFGKQPPTKKEVEVMHFKS